MTEAASPNLVERIRTLHRSGLTPTQISEQVGRARSTVRSILARPTAPPPEPPGRPAYYADSPGPGACSWPLSDGRPWRFCPEPRHRGGVYCAEHTRQATGGRSWHAEAA